MWVCPSCGKSFKNTNQKHDCSAEITTIDAYIAQAPKERRDALKQVRATIRAAAPEAVESIKWRMPTFFQNENLIHFAYNKNHLGIYPGDGGVRAFAQRLALEGYHTTKGAIQFPWNKPIPLELIAEIARYRVKEATGRAE